LIAGLFLYSFREEQVWPWQNSNSEGLVSVVFYVVMPSHLWKFDSSHHQVKLVFGDEKLGGWQNYVGEFEVVRLVTTCKCVTP